MPSDGTKSAQWNPEPRLGWNKQLPNSINISVLVDVNSDRYTHASDANTDMSYGRFRTQRITGKDGQEFQPFLEYSPRLIFTPFFMQNSATSHNFTVGTDKTYNFDGNWHPVAHAAIRAVPGSGPFRSLQTFGAAIQIPVPPRPRNP